MLGLERLLSEDDPKLADGAVLSAHQVDALSGTLTALIAEAERQNGNGVAEDEELEEEEEEDEDEEDLYDESGEDAEDWLNGDLGKANGRTELEEDEQLPEQPEDPGAARRFWFEHATGAGKTVAALGFVEASRTGGVLILPHRRNLVDQFNGKLRARGSRHPTPAPLPSAPDPANGPGTGETD